MSNLQNPLNTYNSSGVFDIILSVNNIPVQSVKDLEVAANNNDELILHVQRGNRTAFILLK